jgi:heme/copper-type cytochrome/quinol oxidase subunit 3
MGHPPQASQARKSALPNGVWGVILFVCTEAAFFGSLVASYFYLQFQSHQWPPPGIEAPSVALPLALTGGLVLTTVPMWLAAAAARGGNLRAVIGLVTFATLAQAGYLAVQITSYLSDLDKFSLTGTAYGSIYFTLLGSHHAHVAVGLLINLWLLASVSRGLTAYRVSAVRVVAWYWYFVAAVAVLVVAAQVSPS